jgi:predicted transcriptional regulator
VLLSWDDDALSTGKRKIPWSQIRKVELASPARSKWLLSASPMFVLYLKDGTRSHIQTDHLLSKKELNQAVTLLQETLQEQKQDR